MSFVEITPEQAHAMGNPKLARTYVKLFDDLVAGNVSEEDRLAVETSIGVLIGSIINRYVCLYSDINYAPIPGFVDFHREDESC